MKKGEGKGKNEMVKRKKRREEAKDGKVKRKSEQMKRRRRGKENVWRQEDRRMGRNDGRSARCKEDKKNG